MKDFQHRKRCTREKGLVRAGHRLCDCLRKLALIAENVKANVKYRTGLTEAYVAANSLV